MQDRASPNSTDRLSPRGAAAYERILSAARDELADTGDVEVSKVAQRAGVSAGLPFRHFGSRSGLLSAVIHAVGDATASAIGFVRMRDAIELGARNIGRAQRDGELPDDRDPELMVAGILGGIHTAVAVALAREPRTEAARLTDELWTFVQAASGLIERKGTRP